MAKEKTNQPEEKNPGFDLTFPKSERFRLISGFFSVLFSIFLLLAMISYLFTWKSDNIEWINVLSASDFVVENWGGKVGAFLSHTLINKWFGLASFFVPFLIFLIGLKLLKRPLLPLLQTLIFGVSIMVTSSLYLGLVDNYMSNVYFLLGGQHGYFIVEWLMSFLGQIGSILLLGIIGLALVITISKKAFDAIKNKIHPKETVDLSHLMHQNESDIFATTSEEKPEETPSEQEEILIIDEQVPAEEQAIENEPETEPNPSTKNAPNQIAFTITQTPNEISETEVDIVEEEADDEDSEQIDIKDEFDALLDMTVEIHEEEASDDIDVSYEMLGDFDPRADLSHFKFPSKDILLDHEVSNTLVTPEELNENKDKIVETLLNYKIEITSISATIGPSITLYEIVPAPGIRISKIKNLEDDIALSLAALGIRIIAPMPGKGTVGIEVPNKNPQIVSMRTTITSKNFQESKFELPIILGKNIYNQTHAIDLAKTPHMLVAGATGQGKSVGINAILTSLLYKKHPAELKLVLIDPKKVELSLYSKIEKHYLAKLPNAEEAIITDVQKVVATLNALAKEMDNRYDLLKNAHVRNIIEYNAKFISRKLNPEKDHRYLPYIVVVIDEFADLIMTAGKEVEQPIARIAQLARAIGIHLIVATQRPSTNVITGIIKANFPTRVAFRVTQMIDSRTILDSPGANQLVGRGDMLISQGGGEMIRLQCPFIDTAEVDDLVTHIQSQQSYATAYLLPEVETNDIFSNSGFEAESQQRDELFEDAARLMIQTQQGSTSGIQRRFSIGYNRAGRIVDQLEAAGIIGPYEGSKARKVLFQDEFSLEQFLKNLR